MEVGTATVERISPPSYEPHMLFKRRGGFHELFGALYFCTAAQDSTECLTNGGSSCLCSTWMSLLWDVCRTSRSESHPHTQNEGRSRSYRVHEGSPWCCVRHHCGLWGNDGRLWSKEIRTINARYASAPLGTDVIDARKSLSLFTWLSPNPMACCCCCWKYRPAIRTVKSIMLVEPELCVCQLSHKVFFNLDG